MNIGRLRGVVAEAGEDDVLIDVGGVGWVVRCGTRTLARLPPPGEETVLHVETQWSAEQGPRLYGFLGRDERRAFTALQGVQGVGPKAALGVLDVLTPAELVQAVAREDRAVVGRANGVGPKLALRIVTELKDKVLTGPGAFQPASAATPSASFTPSVAGEAISALMGLGYAESAARRAVDHAVLRLGEHGELSAVIRAALQEAGR